MELLVIGGSGLVGLTLVEKAKAAGVNVHATYRSTETEDTAFYLDKTDPDRTRAVIEDVDPDVVVDTAAFHDVDACETERQRAWKVNATGTRNVAVAASDIGAQVVYLSTDYVFPGDPTDAPYAEDAAVSPLNYYARSKYAGEQAVKIADSATVLRSSVVYGNGASNFVTWALDELEAGNEIHIVDDQVSTPTYAPDLAKACLEVANRGLTGVYHAAGPVGLPRYALTVTLADVYGYDSELVSRISTEAFGQEAPRPADSSLDSTALYNAIDYEFRRPVRAFETMYRDAERTT